MTRVRQKLTRRVPMVSFMEGTNDVGTRAPEALHGASEQLSGRRWPWARLAGQMRPPTLPKGRMTAGERNQNMVQALTVVVTGDPNASQAKVAVKAGSSSILEVADD